jgi:protein subunit release factor B
MVTESDRKLVLSVTLKDCDVQTFRSGGPGGQHQNKTNSGVRIKHRDSGAVGECREQRSQLQNKRTAFVRMTETKKFQTWLKIQLGHETMVEYKVSEDLRPRNLKIEGVENGEWVPIK